MPLMLHELGTIGAVPSAKQPEPYILTLAAGALFSAERYPNVQVAKESLLSNPAGGPFGDKYIVLVPAGQDPKASAGPYQIVYGNYANQYVVKGDGGWTVSPTAVPASAKRGISPWVWAGLGVVALIGVYAATKKHGR